MGTALVPSNHCRVRKPGKIYRWPGFELGIAGDLIQNCFDIVKRFPATWAEYDHKQVIKRVRKEQEGFESGRHDAFPRAMQNELERMANESEARDDLPEYAERLREIAKTYEKRAKEAHRGGKTGRGKK